MYQIYPALYLPMVPLGYNLAMKLVQMAGLSALFLVIVFSFALPEPALASGPLDGPLVLSVKPH